MANLSQNTKLLERLFNSFTGAPSGDTAIRTMSVTPVPCFGQAKISTSPQQLASNLLTNGVILTAKSTNTGSIFIGGSGVTSTADGTGNGYILEAGSSISFACDNTSDLYVIGNANDVLAYAGS